jgi:hypothetical protein
MATDPSDLSIAFSSAPGPESVALADFNGDTKLDLVTANERHPHRHRAARMAPERLEAGTIIPRPRASTGPVAISDPEHRRQADS